MDGNALGPYLTFDRAGIHLTDQVFRTARRLYGRYGVNTKEAIPTKAADIQPAEKPFATVTQMLNKHVGAFKNFNGLSRAINKAVKNVYSGEVCRRLLLLYPFMAAEAIRRDGAWVPNSWKPPKEYHECVSVLEDYWRRNGGAELENGFFSGTVAPKNIRVDGHGCKFCPRRD